MRAAWISTWAETSPSVTAVTMPGSALRAEVADSASPSAASSGERHAEGGQMDALDHPLVALPQDREPARVRPAARGVGADAEELGGLADRVELHAATLCRRRPFRRSARAGRDGPAPEVQPTAAPDR